jgi:hypothetical protein
VSGESILQTHAEVAVVLAGFASVAAVLGRPLSPTQRQRFLSTLFATLFQVLASLVPVWLSIIHVVGPALWRTVTAFALVLTLTHLFATVFVPLRSLGANRYVIINAPVSFIAWALVVVMLGALLLNLLGVPTAPGFGLYYLALLSGLTVSFLVFADVVLIGDRDDS